MRGKPGGVDGMIKRRDTEIGDPSDPSEMNL
jgi:hypothetical protein